MSKQAKLNPEFIKNEKRRVTSFKNMIAKITSIYAGYYYGLNKANSEERTKEVNDYSSVRTNKIAFEDTLKTLKFYVANKKYFFIENKKILHKDSVDEKLFNMKLQELGFDETKVKTMKNSLLTINKTIKKIVNSYRNDWEKLGMTASDEYLTDFICKAYIQRYLDKLNSKAQR